MKKQRILSIDIFRGLTIFMMVFVNDLAGVSNIPDWMKHVPAGYDGMTFVDVVFPAFLFIVGMAIPFAVEKRFSTGESNFKFWKHVLIRTIGLLILGVYMVNSGEMNREANLIPHGAWTVSLYLAAIMIWNAYPKADDTGRKRLYQLLRIIGFVILLILYFLYRKGPDEQLTGITPSWWGILGLIGWAYLISMVLYMLAGKKLIPVSGLTVLLLGLFITLRTEGVDFLPWLKGQTGHMAHASLTMGGILCSLILAQDGIRANARRKMIQILTLGLICSVIAYLVRPVTGGIAKIGATPAWSLYCISICTVIFVVIYWLVDNRGWKRWASFLKPAGQNPLLAYILPPIFYAIAGFSFLPAMFNAGMLGFVRSVIFSLLILWVADILTKKGIRLHL
jgi:predicted acyltransferase